MSMSQRNPAISLLFDKLATLGLEEHCREVVRQIVNKEFSPAHRGPFSQWAVNDVVNWISQIHLGVAHISAHAAEVLQRECVDGYTFLNMGEPVWEEELQLDPNLRSIAKTIVQGWDMNLHMLEDIGDSSCGTNSGTVTDLGGFSRDIALEAVKANSDCEACGVGGIYGLITVLGCKEAQDKKGEAIPIGTSNDSYVLRRRKVANGTTLRAVESDTDAPLPPTTVKTIEIVAPQMAKGAAVVEQDPGVFVVALACDPLRDVFQVGRGVTGGNDFVVPGAVHANKEGCAAGPVSRFACRIECERLAPFRVFVLAGGFHPVTQSIVAPLAFTPCQHQPHNHQQLDAVDGFTTFGVRILQPEVGQWVEVSVRGRTYQPRRQPTEAPQQRVDTTWGNQLTDGTIIDIGGVCLLYRSPVAMARTPEVDPTRAVELLNSLKPQCPVLFNEISFSYVDAKERLQRARTRAYEASALGVVPSGVQVPVVDYSHLPEGNRPYVFPSCGHIFSYHQSLEGRPCPLCRREGAFVPIAFSFEPSICDKFPTHVFNPCGHVASHETCERWARLLLPSRTITDARHVHMCPYCATELVEPPLGPAYSRLSLQTETDKDWPNGDALTHEMGDPTPAIAPDEGIVSQYAPEHGDEGLAAVVRAQQVLFQRENGGEARRARGAAVSLRKQFPTYAPQLGK